MSKYDKPVNRKSIFWNGLVVLLFFVIVILILWGFKVMFPQ